MHTEYNYYNHSTSLYPKIYGVSVAPASICE